jgi:anti-sigma factor RsiW
MIKLDILLIDRYLAGELSSAERAQFERWLAEAAPEVQRIVARLVERLRRPDIGLDASTVRERKRATWARLFGKLDTRQSAGGE